MDKPTILQEAITLIIMCEEQFRFYEANHRAKNTPEALEKAEVNKQLADKLKAWLDD